MKPKLRFIGRIDGKLFWKAENPLRPGMHRYVSVTAEWFWRDRVHLVPEPSRHRHEGK